MMNARKWAAIAGLGLGLSLAGGVAQGALLSFEDDDVDFILRAPGGVLNPTPVTSGPFQAGDLFVSVFEIPVFTINGANAIPTGQELTGVVAVQLQNTPGSTVGSVLNFGPPAVGLNAILALGADPDAAVVNGGPGQGATVAMWFNGTAGGADVNLLLNRSTDPATNCPTMAFCIDQASMGQLVQVDGFGAANNFWQSVLLVAGANDIGQVIVANNALAVANFNAGQTTFFNLLGGTVGGIDVATGQACANPGTGTCVNATLTGPITGGQGLANGGFAHSDFDGQKLTVTAVPEPGVLTLLGAALLAFGFAWRKRKA